MRAIFDRGASDHNFAPVAEQKRAKNSRFSASIFSQPRQNRPRGPIYIYPTLNNARGHPETRRRRGTPRAGKLGPKQPRVIH